MNTRAEALGVIKKVLEEGAYLNDTLHVLFAQKEKNGKNAAGKENGTADFSRQDKAFLVHLTTGTVKRAIEMDARINMYAKTKVKRMHPVVRNILRMSVYQIYYMDSVPDSAAVNEAVKLAKKNGQAKAAGFINGILRSMLRKEREFSYDENASKTVEDISVKYSLPGWIVDILNERWDTKETIDIAKGFLAPAPVTIRVNCSKISPADLKDRLEKEGVTVNPVFLDGEAVLDAFVLEDFGAVDRMEAFREGLFFVQDLASMQVVKEADILAGEAVIDVCAAPGGKAMHAADRGGKVLARDISEGKIKKIMENVRRADFSEVTAEVWDARRLDPLKRDSADVVIADLPCSGLGVLKRKPEIKYRLKKEDIMELADLQGQILRVVCDYVKPGGRLVFSTCTITKEEDEENTRSFLSDHPQFHLEKERLIKPTPTTDGFYIAVMKRNAV